MMKILRPRARDVQPLAARPDRKLKAKPFRSEMVAKGCVYGSTLFPALTAADAVVAIQIGYCASDIISKCGVGLVIYQITYAKSAKEGLLG